MQYKFDSMNICTYETTYESYDPTEHGDVNGFEIWKGNYKFQI